MKHLMRSQFFALSWIALAAFATSRAVAAVSETDGMAFFEKEVRPVLVNRCYQCHSVAKKTKGGLALDSKESTLKGGDSGPALVAGDPEQSKLIEAVRYKNHDLQMPPKGELPAEEIKTLEAWIKMGAPDPRAGEVAAAANTKGARVINIEEGRKFWSFKPIARVEPPAVPGRAVAIKNPIDAFIQAKLKEKGLTSAPPADKRTLIRRATFDLIGLPPTPKDVDAFLADKSPEAFDRVIERLLASPQYGERWGRHWLDVARYADSNGMDENIAFGNAWRYRDYVVRAFNSDKPFDQFLIEQMAGDLLPYSEEAITATGFLSLGARVLAEPDVRKLQMDIIDEQIDTTGKAFLGMTLGCARCHDHKFDPIKQADYYAMAAIFRSTRSLSDEKMGAIKFWNEHSLATPEQLAGKKKYDEAVKARHAAVAAFTAKARSDLKAELQSRAADYLTAAAMLPADEAPADVERLAKAFELRPQYLLSCRRYLDRVPDLPFFATWREFADEDADDVREHYEPLVAEALKTKKGPAYDALIDPKGFLAIPDAPADSLDAATVAKITAMNEEVMAFEEKAPELPAIMSVADDKIVKTLPIHLGGSYLTLGKPVERGWPEVMRTSFAREIFPAKQSGRLQLARWMASSENPLTARVLVNRVWRWHFGQGIVSSTENFGLLGSRPSHPELLDWLATTFIENGWSIKDLHRLIMKSAVYQESSTANYSMADGGADPRAVDPENRLLWRANIQRLEAEEIRDAMLSVSGWLDLTMGGKTIPLRDREFVFNHTSKDHTTYESARRALYLPIVRNNLYNMLEQFDYPDPTMPTGSRNSTVIAPQALIMMNSPVVMECGARLAVKLASLPSDEARVREIYALVYNREPSERERDRVLAAVQDFGRGGKPGSAWSLMCQTLLAANEFIYLR
jgi:cytochrome c553